MPENFTACKRPYRGRYKRRWWTGGDGHFAYFIPEGGITVPNRQPIEAVRVIRRRLHVFTPGAEYIFKRGHLRLYRKR